MIWSVGVPWPPAWELPVSVREAYGLDYRGHPFLWREDAGRWDARARRLYFWGPYGGDPVVVASAGLRALHAHAEAIFGVRPFAEAEV